MIVPKLNKSQSNICYTNDKCYKMEKKLTTFENLNALRIRGTKTGLDGQAIPLSFFNTVVGKSIKLNYAFPTQLAVSADLFSNTLTKFDNTNLTFDDSTP